MGICRSVCRMVFGTYHGTLTIDLRTLFWNLCSISVLELLAVPQRGMPYVQMGFRIVLYISSLFSSDSFDFRPIIQYMRWSCNPSCLLLVKMCFCHVSLRSRWMPKYLAVSPCGICCPFSHKQMAQWLLLCYNQTSRFTGFEKWHVTEWLSTSLWPWSYACCSMWRTAYETWGFCVRLLRLVLGMNKIVSLRITLTYRRVRETFVAVEKEYILLILSAWL